MLTTFQHRPIEITRKIEIDAAHRVPDHRSKCKYLHGHRYVIEATCVGELAEEGEQKGMVLDFGFLKELMLNHLEKWVDHGLILYVHDPYLEILYPDNKDPHIPERIEEWIARDGYAAARRPQNPYPLKLYIIDSVPTAENLARIWFKILKPDVAARSDGRARLESLTVWETPNCWATHRAPKQVWSRPTIDEETVLGAER